jgi:hypothetical protein
MKKIFLCLAAVLIVFSLKTAAQVVAPELEPADMISVGLGGGLDYGGFGANLLFYPQENIGVFGGVGYALAGLGYNVGAKFRLTTLKTKLNPYAQAMYGYNAAITIIGAKDYNKLFYGPTVGLGIDLRPGKVGYWSFGILLPIRSNEVQEYIDNLVNTGVIESDLFMLPIGISFGYRFVIL